MIQYTRKLRGFLRNASGQSAKGVIVHLAVELDDKRRLPVGTLQSDRAGYVSFSLAAIGDLSGIVGYRMAVGSQEHVFPADTPVERPVPHFFVPTDAGAKGDVGCGCGGAHATLPAIQDPDDADREISPRSFSALSEAIVGDGDCADLVPGGLARHTYGMYRVVRIAHTNDSKPEIDERGHLEFGNGGETATMGMGRVSLANPLPDSASTLQVGIVLEFQQDWQPVGQSLGDMVYSLPLAPGESRNLAMIDWSRTDDFSRSDRVVSNERLEHQQGRDRTVEEAVNAALHEHQEGWSFLAGTAGAASATIPIEGVDLAISGTHSLGVGFSSSTGDRNVAADSLQTLHDGVNQTTSVLRSLRSTVIVQSQQAESNQIATRTISNNNRCHALTIQYYEVLRNYRVVSRFVSASPALLVPYETIDWNDDRALRWRSILEPRLLDRRLAAAFDALAFKKVGTYDPAGTGPANTARTGSTTTTPLPVPPTLVDYEVTLETGNRETWGAVWVYLVLTDGTRHQILLKDSSNHAYGLVPPNPNQMELKKNSVRSFDKNTPDSIVNAIKLSTDHPRLDLSKVTLEQVQVEWVESNPSDAWQFTAITVVGIDSTGIRYPIKINGKSRFSGSPLQDFRSQGSTHATWAGTASIDLPTTTPAATTPPVTEPLETEGRDQTADANAAALLVAHLRGNVAYYSRLVWVLMDRSERRMRLVAALGTTVADRIDDIPLAVSGDQVAYRLAGEPSRIIPDWERLVQVPEERVQYLTLPTRGVFAEAELGRCNACERRDVTRMTDWVNNRAPEIVGITPGPRGTLPDVTAASLPGNVVQVISPAAAPDPVGLAGSLKLLGTPNVFRDMSGMAQLGTLLNALAEGAISLTQAQIMARQLGGGKAGTASTGAGSTGSTGTSGSSLASGAALGAALGSTAGFEPDAAKQVDRIDALRHGVDSGLINQGTAQDAAKDIVGGGGHPLQKWLMDTVLGATPPPLAPPPGRACCLLGFSGSIEPSAVINHRYGSTSLSNVGYVYTEHAGFVDIGHLRDHADLTKYVYDAIKAGATAIPCREGTATLTGSPADPVATAQAIAYVDSWAHELRTIGFNVPGADNSAFSPEDLPSNFLGTLVGASAVRLMGTGGDFDATVDAVLAGLLSTLGARPKADTDSAMVAVKGTGKWWKPALVTIDLLRRNFDGLPWQAGMPFDGPVSATVDPSGLRSQFANFDYKTDPLYSDRSVVSLADFDTKTDAFRAPFRAAGTDHP